MASRINELGKIIKKMESKVVNLEATIFNLDEEIHVKKSKLDLINNSIEVKQEQFKENEKRVSKADARHGSLVKASIKRQQEADGLDNDISRKKLIISGLDKELINKTSLLEQAMISVDNVSMVYEEGVDELAFLQVDTIEAKKKLHIKKEKLRLLTDDIARETENLKKLQNAYTKTKQKIISIDDKLSRIHEREKSVSIRERRYKKLRFNQ